MSNTEIKKCQKNREVNCCEECIRFQECHNPDYKRRDLTKGEEKLGIIIITDVVEDFRRAWKYGNKGELQQAILFLKSDKVGIYSLYKFHSDFIIDKTSECCRREYGDFEEIYNKKKEKCKKALEPLYKELEPYLELNIAKERLSKNKYNRYVEILERKEKKQKITTEEREFLQKIKNKLKLNEKEKEKVSEIRKQISYWLGVLNA